MTPGNGVFNNGLQVAIFEQANTADIGSGFQG